MIRYTLINQKDLEDLDFKALWLDCLEKSLNTFKNSSDENNAVALNIIDNATELFKKVQNVEVEEN